MAGLIKNQNAIFKSPFSVTAKWLLGLAAIALTIKLLLQLGSTIPSLSTLAFGFRPIVIGYLHLVLLGVITLFLIGFMFAANFIAINKKATAGAGIIINEVFLMTQGVGALDYINIPYINTALLVAAVIMFAGLLLLNISQQNKLQK